MKVSNLLRRTIGSMQRKEETLVLIGFPLFFDHKTDHNHAEQYICSTYCIAVSKDGCT